MNLNGKIVWITGSSRGIGKAAALQFAAKGARVVVSARSVDEIDAIVGEINANGDSALAIPCDVTNNNQIISLVSAVKKTWGDLDILVNNAGIGIFKNILELEEEEWDRMMNVNLKSAFLCSKAVLPAMIEQQSGQIINIVSVAGKQPFENSGGYCASKYGMLGFTDVLRLENRKHGVRVSAVLPGATSTPIWGDADVDHNRMMTADDVAKTIVSLCEINETATIEEVVMRPHGGDL
jgi:NAD(P)-dependent dehydrogenase (short-subunit alcohol dehydrogenase family)